MAATLESEAPLDADMAYRALNTLTFAVHKTAPAALQKVQFGDVLSTARDDTLEKKRLASAVKPRTRVSVNRLQAEDYVSIDLKQDDEDLSFKAGGDLLSDDHRDDESICGAHAAGSVAMSFKSYTADSRSFKSLQRGTTHYVPQFNDAHAMAPVASSNAVVAALKAKTRLMHDLESVHTITSLVTALPTHSRDQLPLPGMSTHLASFGSQAPSPADHLFDQLQSALTSNTPKVRGGRRASISLSAAAFSSGGNNVAVSPQSSSAELLQSASTLFSTFDSPLAHADTLSVGRSSGGQAGADAVPQQPLPTGSGAVADGGRAEGEAQGRRRGSSLYLSEDRARSGSASPVPGADGPLMRRQLECQISECSDGRPGDKPMSSAQVEARRRHSLAMHEGVGKHGTNAAAAPSQRRASVMMPLPSHISDDTEPSAAAGGAPPHAAHAPCLTAATSGSKVRRASTSMVSLAAAHVLPGAHHSMPVHVGVVGQFSSGSLRAAAAAAAGYPASGAERVPAFGRRSNNSPTPAEEGAGALEGEGSFKRLQGGGSNRGRQSRLAESQSAFDASAIPGADHHDAQDSAASNHGGLISTIKSWMMGAEAAGAHR